MNEWFVNEDKSITFYDAQQFTDFATGLSRTQLKSENENETVTIKMYEHKAHLGEKVPKLSPQVNGYDVSLKSPKSRYSTQFIMPLGRRLRVPVTNEKTKKVTNEFSQTQDQVEILVGLQEAPELEEAPEVEEALVTTEVTTETTSPVVETVPSV